MGLWRLTLMNGWNPVEFTEEFLVVGLKDGRRISVPIECIPGLPTLQVQNFPNGKSVAVGTAFTGRTLTKTSAPKGFYGVHRHLTSKVGRARRLSENRLIYCGRA